MAVETPAMRVAWLISALGTLALALGLLLHIIGG